MVQTERLAVFRFPAQAEQLRLVRELIRDTLDALRCDKQYIEHTVLAVDEAVTNIIRHAYGDHAHGDIILEVLRSGDTLVFRLSDFAPPVDKHAIRPRALDNLRPGGLGTYIIQEIMDKVEFVTPSNGMGNILELYRELER